MIEGIDGIMNLAAASGEDLATTSDIVTDALTAFGMSAEQSGELADVLAASSSNANTNVSMMGESFKYVASVAGSMGYTAQDTSIALGLMANSGIKASQAGTSLRSIMSRMAAPTKQVDAAMSALGLSIDDGEGNMKSFREIMNDLRAAFADSGISMEEYEAGVAQLTAQFEAGELTEKQYNAAVEELATQAFSASGALNAQYASAIAGKNGMSGLLAIVGASEDDYNKLCDAVDHASDSVEYQGEVYEGTAAKMAAVMNDNLEGQITLLKSALEELAISFGDILMPIVRDVVAKIQDVVNWLNNLDDGTKKTIVQIGAVVAAAGPLLIGIGKVSQGLSSTIDLVTKAKNGFGLFSGATEGLTGTISKLPGGIGIAVAAIGGIVAVTEGVCTAINNHIDAVEDELEAMDGERAMYGDLIEKAKGYKEEADKAQENADQAVANYEAQEKKAGALKDKLGELIDKEQLSNTEKERAKELVDMLNQIYPDLGWNFDENSGKVQDNTGKILENSQALEDNMKKTQEAAKEKAYQTAVEDQTTALVNQEIAYKDASDSLDYYNQIIIEGKKKQEELRAAGKQDSEEYEKLSKNIEAAQKKFDEAQQVLNGCTDGLRESHEKLLLLNNEMETGGLSEMGQGMIDNLHSLQETAKTTGVEVPAQLALGMQNGSIGVRDAAKYMASLETLNTMIDESGKIGGQIPKEIANQMIASAPSLEEANAQINNLISIAEGLEKSRKAGEEIPQVLSECLANGAVSVQEKMNAYNQYTATGSTQMAETLIQNTKNGVDGAEKAIEDSVLPEKMGQKMNSVTMYADENLKIDKVTGEKIKKSEEEVTKSKFDEYLKEKSGKGAESWIYNLNQLQPSTSNAIAEASAAIIQSDADKAAERKANEIYHAFDLSRLSGDAQQAAYEINRGLADVKTDYQIRFEITSNGGTGGWGSSQMLHADGGVFLKPTLLPSLAGNPHIVGEAGAEAILPIKDLEPMIQNSLAKVLFEVENAKARAGSTVKIDYDKLAAAFKSSLQDLNLNASFAVGANVITREVIPLVDRGLERIRKKR